MILREATIGVQELDSKLVFICESMEISEKVSVTIPARTEDGVGTIETFTDRMIYHPPNGDDKVLTPKMFLRMMEQMDSITGLDIDNFENGDYNEEYEEE